MAKRAGPRRPAPPSTPDAPDAANAANAPRQRDDAAAPAPGDDLVRRHLAFGWWSLAVFTALGLLLEAAHGLKLGWYLDVVNATRRLSFTLGHAHGTLLGLVNIAFALSLGRLTLSPTAISRASFALRAVTILLPLGFLLGGVAFYAGDPGFAIALVPPSGLLLVVALVVIARGVSRR
jgi:hypothetical protein